jgi:hypothetical protein
MKLVDVDARSLSDIKEGLIDLGDAIAYMLDKVGDENSSARIRVSPSGRIIVGTKGEANGELQVHGRLAININNMTPDVDLATAGPVRLDGKKFEVGAEIPQAGLYNHGDVVWNNEPQPGGCIGWVCIRTGTPGLWKEFGKIEL